MNLMFSGNGLPFNLLSHMISLIKPIASVVLASSKNNTVSTGGEAFLLCSANSKASFTLSSICFSVIPP